MATRTVTDKLLIKGTTTVWTSQPARRLLLGTLPDGARHVDDLAEATVAILVADDVATLQDTLASVGDRLTGTTTLWVVYPKANRTDLNRDSLWPHVTQYSLRPNGQESIDDTWSAMRFRALKEGEAPFTGGR